MDNNDFNNNGFNNMNNTGLNNLDNYNYNNTNDSQNNLNVNYNQSIISNVVPDLNQSVNQNDNFVSVENNNSNINQTINSSGVLNNNGISPNINNSSNNLYGASNYNQSINQNITTGVTMNNNYNVNPNINQSVYPDLYSINGAGQTVNVEKRKKSNFKIFIIVGILVLVVAVILFLVFNRLSVTKDNFNSKGSNVFWLYDGYNYSALFDIDGNQITEFDYKVMNDNLDYGTSVVKNKDEKYGVISSKGKMLVDFGKYEYISSSDSVYELKDADGTRVLYSNTGKIIKELEQREYVTTYNGGAEYAILRTPLKYTLINNLGDKILELDYIDEDEIDSPIIDEMSEYQSIYYGKYISLFYNNVNYIVDLETKKVVISFNEDKQYCIFNVNEENEKEMILFTCNDTEYDNKTFKMIRNGKVMFTTSYDGSSYISFKNGNIIVSKGSPIYILNDRGEEILDLNDNVTYIDGLNYVKENNRNDGSELYVNGKFVKSLDCSVEIEGYAQYGNYLLHCDGGKVYMTSDGKIINEESFKFAYEFDENGYAVVSEDGTKFYLIDKNGNKVSSDYYRDGSYNIIHDVQGHDDLYYAKKADGKVSVFEVNGKEIVSGDNISPVVVNNQTFGIITVGSSYVVYDFNKNKEIGTYDFKPISQSKYFEDNGSSGKTRYYSFVTGKIMYEG